MADISNQNKTIPVSAFKNMEKRVTTFINANGRNPNIVYITSRKVDWVTWSRYSQMKTWYTNNPKSKTIPLLKSTVVPPVPLYKKVAANEPVNLPTTTIYVGPTTITPKNAPQIYGTQSAPYYSCTLTFTLFAANTVDFESPTKYGNMARVNVIGEHKPFGGQIDDPKETQDGYTYSCMDYTRLLFGKWAYHYSNVRVSTIIKDILKEVGLPTNGIMTTGIIHPTLAGNFQKRIDICHQLAGLDDLEFLINKDGIPILRETPQSTTGYVFFTEESVSDYSIEHNATSIVTSVKVFGKDGKYLYGYANQNMLLVYGDITDILEDSNLASKGEAKTAGLNLYTTDNSSSFAGSITVPEILDIEEGEWLIFVPPKWSSEPIKAYYSQQVKIQIDSTTNSTTIQFLDGKPPLPSEWIYTDPTTGEAVASCGTDSTQKNMVCATAKPSVGNTGLAYRNYDSCFLNHCPVCKKDGTLKFNPKHVAEGEWTCYHPIGGCDSDFDATKGKIKLSGKSTHLTLLKGPTKSSRSVGKMVNPSTSTSCSSTSSSGLAKKLPKTVKTACQLYQWFKNHVKYLFYYNSRYSPTQVMSKGYGNCVDQSQLAVALLTGLGYTAETVKLTAYDCGTFHGGHEHVKIKVNGVWKIWDTSCHKESQIHGCSY